MRLRGSSRALFLTAFVTFIGLLASCGGGDSAGNGSQDGNSSGKEKRQGEAAQKKAPEPKIALGTIKKVNSEKRRIILQPSNEIQGGKREIFRITKNAKISLDGEKVELADIKEGQQAQIKYIAKKERRNRARVVELFEGDETTPSEAGEKTG